MRVLTILAALVLAMIGGAYGALVLSGGGAAVGEPYVVVPVKPAPIMTPAKPTASTVPVPPAPLLRISGQ